MGLEEQLARLRTEDEWQPASSPGPEPSKGTLVSDAAETPAISLAAEIERLKLENFRIQEQELEVLREAVPEPVGDRNQRTV